MDNSMLSVSSPHTSSTLIAPPDARKDGSSDSGSFPNNGRTRTATRTLPRNSCTLLCNLRRARVGTGYSDLQLLMATPNPLNNRSDQSCCSNLPFTNNSVLPCIPLQLETAERELELVIQIYNSWVAGSTCEANLKNVNMLGPVYAILANNDPNDILGKIEEPCALHLMTTNQVSDNILREQILETNFIFLD